MKVTEVALIKHAKVVNKSVNKMKKMVQETEQKKKFGGKTNIGSTMLYPLHVKILIMKE